MGLLQNPPEGILMNQIGRYVTKKTESYMDYKKYLPLNEGITITIILNLEFTLEFFVFLH